jgi:hypothetical protein
MKKYIIPFLFTGLLAFVGCNKKSTEPSSEAQAEVEVPTPDVSDAEVSPAQRAAKLGFAQYLPANVSAYSAVINGSSVIDRMWKTPVGAVIKERLEEEGISFDDLSDPQAQMSGILQLGAAQYGEDYFVAYGESAPKVSKDVIEFSDRMSYYVGRMAVYAGNAAVAGKLFEENVHPNKLLTELFTKPLKGLPANFIHMFREVDMPSYYQGVKVSGEDSRALVRDQLEAVPNFFSMIEVGVEPLVVERGGAQFEGYKFSGKKMQEELAEGQGGMRLVLEPGLKQFGMSQQEIDEFIKLIEAKTIVALVGEVHGYVVLFMGSSEDDFVLVDDVEDSLCASDKIKFTDDYLDNDLFTYGFSDGGMGYDLSAIEKICYKLGGSFAKGLSDQLAESDSLGNTQEIEVILDNIDKQARGLAAMFKEADAGYVAYLEDGIKVEMQGGSNMPQYDMQSAHTLAPISQGKGQVLFANWATDPQYNEGLMTLIDRFVEVSYLMSKQVLPLLASRAAADEGNADFIQYNASLQMFDQMFSKDLLDVWQALRTNMAEGLGAETALVIDVNGSLPKVPMLPKAIIEGGKMPRVAYVSTVDDREKLQASWTRLNTALESLLKKASEMTGAEIPMQVPMSSEKDGLKTWFVPIPFQNDDFVPSVSVSDDLFFATTSKRFAEGLSSLAAKGGGESRQGVWLDVDMKVLHSYAEQWLKLIEENAAEFMSDVELEDFNANKEMIETTLSALGMMDSLTYHMRQEDGVTRTSMHLKTK